MKSLFRASGTGIGSLIIGSTAFLSYVIGLVRDKILAYVFGTSALSDIYNASFIIPDFILNACILGALSGVFIPIMVEHIHEGQEKADELGSIFLTVMSLFVLAVSLLAMIFAPQLVPLTVPKLEPALMDQAVMMTRLMLVYPVILGLSTTFGSVLQSYGHFLSYGLSSVLYNCGIILGALLLVPYFGVLGAGLGVVLGYVAHMAVRWYELRMVPFHYRPRWDIRNKAFRTILAMMIPRAITLLTLTLVIQQFSVVSNTLGEGIFTAQNYARNFQSFAITLFGVSIATAALTEMSRHMAAKDTKAFALSFEGIVSQTLFFAMPATVGLIFVAEPMIALFLRGGAFDARSLIMTASMLVIFSMAIPFESMIHVYSRGLYAMKRVYLPTFASIIYCIVNLLLLQWLLPTWRELTIPLSWTLANMVQSVLLFIIFHGFLKVPMHWAKTSLNVFKICLASAFMGLGLWGIAQLHLDTVASFSLEVVLGSLIFALAAWVLQIQEFRQLFRFFVRLAARYKARIIPSDIPPELR